MFDDGDFVENVERSHAQFGNLLLNGFTNYSDNKGFHFTV